jgi:hypothetical protein
MNNEQQQIIDEAYENYWINTNKDKYNNLDCLVKQEAGSFSVVRLYYKEEFINKCKMDNEFSEKWGLKIEERELSLEERKKIYESDYTDGTEIYNDYWLESKLTTRNIPTKLITITYNNKTIESYE